MPIEESEYFDFSDSNFPTRAKALSATVRALTQACAAGFAMLPALASFTLGARYYALTTGTANTYIAEIDGIDAYAQFQSILLKFNVANTGASTVDVNGLGTRPLLRSDGEDAEAGDFPVNGIVRFVYNTTYNGYVTEGVSLSILADFEAALTAAEEAVAVVEDQLADLLNPEFTTVDTEENVTARQYGVDHMTITPVADIATFPLDEAGTFDISISANTAVTLEATDATKSYEFTIYATTTGAFNFTGITMTGIDVVRKVGTTINLQASGDTVLSCLYIPAIGKLVVTEIDVEAI